MITVLLGFTSAAIIVYGLLLLGSYKCQFGSDENIKDIKLWQEDQRLIWRARDREISDKIGRLSGRLDAAIEMLRSNAASTKAFMELVNSDRKYDIKEADRDRDDQRERNLRLAHVFRQIACEIEGSDEA